MDKIMGFRPKRSFGQVARPAPTIEKTDFMAIDRRNQGLDTSLSLIPE
jgi:hypothetical protein